MFLFSLEKKFDEPRLTFDLRRKLGGVLGLEQLQLFVQVTDSQIDVPGAKAWKKKKVGI